MSRLRTGRWVSLRVISGKDKIVAEKLSSDGYVSSEDKAFVPEMTHWRRVPKHRVKKVGASREMVETLVTPGYMFVQTDSMLDVGHMLGIRQVYGLVQLGESVFIGNHEIDILKHYCDSKTQEALDVKRIVDEKNSEIDPKSFIGKIVNVCRGNFVDRTGLVTSVKNGRPVVDLGNIEILADPGSLLEAA